VSLELSHRALVRAVIGLAAAELRLRGRFIIRRILIVNAFRDQAALATATATLDFMVSQRFVFAALSAMVRKLSRPRQSVCFFSERLRRSVSLRLALACLEIVVARVERVKIGVLLSFTESVRLLSHVRK